MDDEQLHPRGLFFPSETKLLFEILFAIDRTFRDNSFENDVLCIVIIGKLIELYIMNIIAIELFITVNNFVNSDISIRIAFII